MKHIVHIDSRQFTASGELNFTHCIIGQRDRSKEFAVAPKPLKPGATQEEREAFEKSVVARRLFTANDAQGRYAMKPLEWTESLEAANREAEIWKQEGWLNVAVIPVETNLPNA